MTFTKQSFLEFSQSVGAASPIKLYEVDHSSDTTPYRCEIANLGSGTVRVAVMGAADNPVAADVSSRGTLVAVGGFLPLTVPGGSAVFAVATSGSATVSITPVYEIQANNPLLVHRHPSIVSHFSAQVAFQQIAATSLAVADADPVGYWPDLIGGYDCIAPSDDVLGRPVLKLGANGVAGLPGIVFSNSDGTNANCAKKLTSASTTFWDQFATTGYTVIALVTLNQTTNRIRIICGNATGTSNPYMGLNTQSSAQDRVIHSLNANATGAINTTVTGSPGAAALAGNSAAYENATVLHFTNSGTAKALDCGRASVSAGTGTGTGTIAGALVIGNLGSAAAPNAFPCDVPIHEIAIYSGVLTAAEIQAESARLMSLGTIAPPLVVVDGNSLGRGYYNSVDHLVSALPTLLKGYMKSIAGASDVNTIQLSISGASTYEKINSVSGSASLAALKWLGGFNSFRKMAVCAFEGRNSMAQNGGNGALGVNGNRSAADAWAETVAYGQLLQALGFRNILVWTVAVSKDQTTYDTIFEARRVAYNALARAEAKLYGFKLFDVVARIPALDLTASLADATVYYTDQIHFQPQTYGKIAYYLARFLMELWAQDTQVLLASAA